MVRHPALRKVIGTDLFGAVTGTDLRSSDLSFFFILAALELFIDACSDQAHRSFSVFNLAAAFLTVDGDAGRQMHDSDSTVGFVDVLAAGT